MALTRSIPLSRLILRPAISQYNNVPLADLVPYIDWNPFFAVRRSDFLCFVGERYGRNDLFMEDVHT